MTADTCPFCGAPMIRTSGTRIYWACGSWRLWSIEMQEGATYQGEQCARYVRTRISQLRRMAGACGYARERAVYYSEKYRRELPSYERHEAIRSRLERFLHACISEINRLRAQPKQGKEGVRLADS